jgi:uncharacterized protein YkwD
MNLFKLNLLLVVIVVLSSCSVADDDGIYFDSVNEALELKMNYSEIEMEILDLVNDYRVVKGLSPLEKLDFISSVAKTHTTYMLTTGLVNHDNFPERNEKLVTQIGAKQVGENVAYGYTSAQGVFDAWIQSDDHRKIIENENYTHFGISTECNANGRNYFTQMFVNK